jgi:hypothetical protein
MSIESILTQIDAEIERLQQVRKLLATSGDITAVYTGKKRGPKPGAKRGRKPGPKKGSKRNLSPEARQRIREAQQRRWAAIKSGKKSK